MMSRRLGWISAHLALTMFAQGELQTPTSFVVHVKR